MMNKPSKGTPKTARPVTPALARIEELEGQDSVEISSMAHSMRSYQPGRAGAIMAVSLVMLFALSKVGVSVLENSGVFSVSAAQATMAMPAMQSAVQQQSTTITRDELRVLTSLDGRRAELEGRAKKLDERERDLDNRDREFAQRLTQVRELTDKLKGDREKDDKRRSGQLEQLANVYGSMNPPEAAQLLEQLDVTIALSLIERMPEKRIGQILSSMSPQRALSITQMLSGKANAQ